MRNRKIMNKKIKVLIGIFGITSIFSITETLAITPRFWANVTLPSFSGTVASENASYKDKEGAQYNKATRAVDNVTGGNRSVQVRTLGTKASGWIDSPVGSVVTWDSSNRNGNNKTGEYRLQVKAARSTLATTSYSGTWYLDSEYL